MAHRRKKKTKNGKTMKNDTRSTLSTIEEPNSSQHHDDVPPARSPASTTSPAATKERFTTITHCSSPSSKQHNETIRNIPRFSIICGVRHAGCAGYKYKWLSDSLPAYIASDVLVLSIPDFTPHRICYIFLFDSLCTLHTSRHNVDLQCL